MGVRGQIIQEITAEIFLNLMNTYPIEPRSSKSANRINIRNTLLRQTIIKLLKTDDRKFLRAKGKDISYTQEQQGISENNGGISLVSPVAKTPNSQCRGAWFDPWSRN